uniref:Uncharacterized protein n=1 Tax=Setaria viridis TaxID=4556 RepID=A0A4U6TXR3_SETVI|nr:hypothetical protein SEVIR_8G250166v2 [Setaria viridis]
MGLQFGPAVMPQLRRLQLVFGAKQTEHKFGAFDIGVQNLICLEEVSATINRSTQLEEVSARINYSTQASEAAIRDAKQSFVVALAFALHRYPLAGSPSPPLPPSLSKPAARHEAPDPAPLSNPAPRFLPASPRGPAWGRLGLEPALRRIRRRAVPSSRPALRGPPPIPFQIQSASSPSTSSLPWRSPWRRPRRPGSTRSRTCLRRTSAASRLSWRQPEVGVPPERSVVGAGHQGEHPAAFRRRWGLAPGRSRVPAMVLSLRGTVVRRRPVASRGR